MPYGLGEKEVENFVQDKELSFFFEKTVSELKEWVDSSGGKEDLKKINKTASNYILSDLQGLLNLKNKREVPITAENFAEFINLIFKGEISSKIAKIVLKEMFETGADPSHVIEEKGLSQMKDESQIEKAAQKVILNNRKAVEDFKAGKTNALQFLIGQLMAETRGKINPESANNILRKLME